MCNILENRTSMKQPETWLSAACMSHDSHSSPVLSWHMCKQIFSCLLSLLHIHICMHMITIMQDGAVSFNGNPGHFQNTANAFFSGGSIFRILMANVLKRYFVKSHKTISVSREQESSDAEELEKLFGGWLAVSVQVKMNNLGNTKKSMWHL